MFKTTGSLQGCCEGLEPNPACVLRVREEQPGPVSSLSEVDSYIIIFNTLIITLQWY